ncbi:MAG: group III truncated hemoglobin [Bacteroidota bacterium]
MIQDLINRQDIEKLIIAFYEKVKSDETIGYIFNDVVKVNWEKHLPVMFDFWENALFYTGTYSRDNMNIHRHLSYVTPLRKEHFEQWNKLFIQSVDENFRGPNAELAKQRAISISTVMQIKIIS